MRKGRKWTRREANMVMASLQFGCCCFLGWPLDVAGLTLSETVVTYMPSVSMDVCGIAQPL